MIFVFSSGFNSIGTNFTFSRCREPKTTKDIYPNPTEHTVESTLFQAKISHYLEGLIQ